MISAIEGFVNKSTNIRIYSEWLGLLIVGARLLSNFSWIKTNVVTLTLIQNVMSTSHEAAKKSLKKAETSMMSVFQAAPESLVWWRFVYLKYTFPIETGTKKVPPKGYR